ncbi:MAG: hypothetical protein JSS36_02695 [Proteobacteria bacterium]|nr:hypothetical protein [Pseudomonadota bacterium]
MSAPRGAELPQNVAGSGGSVSGWGHARPVIAAASLPWQREHHQHAEDSMPREIWFKRICTTYWPCHPKGWAVTAGFYLTAMSGAILSLTAFNGSFLVILLFFLPSWAWFMFMAIRHS